MQLGLDLLEGTGGAEAQVVGEAVDEPRLEAIATVDVCVARHAFDGGREAVFGVGETLGEAGVDEVVEQVDLVQTQFLGREDRVEEVEAGGERAMDTVRGQLVGGQGLVRDRVEGETAPRLGLDHGCLGVVEDGGEEGVGFGEVDKRHGVEHLANLEDQLGRESEDDGRGARGARGGGCVSIEEGGEEGGEGEHGQHFFFGGGGVWGVSAVWRGGDIPGCL